MDNKTDGKTDGALSILIETIMTKNVHSITVAMSIREAIHLILEKKVGGAPILDFNGAVISVASEGDLMRLAASEGMEAKISNCLTHLVKTEKLILATRQTPFVEIYRMFLTKKVHRILIVDLNMRLQGIVSRSNVLRVISEAATEKKSA